MRAASVFVILAACGGSPRIAVPPPHPGTHDPDGPHRAAVAEQIQPYIDAEVAAGIVIGLYDAGKLEIYGFGKAAPNGNTLFEIGSITKVYTAMLLADAVQRHEVSLETPVSELLPPGVTMPMRDKTPITLHHLALHNSGLPRLPPKIAANSAATDPYAGYGEDALYTDLVQTLLESPPGAQIVYSNYGFGLLGFVLGKKLGSGYEAVLAERVLQPLGLADTYVTVPAQARARLAKGTNNDLVLVPPWTFDALAGAGALTSSVRDQLKLVDAELDAASGSRQPLRAAMRLTQEPQLDHTGDNEGLGWQIDSAGRYWHNGGTGGFRSFIGFDPKTKRGIVILSSTATSLVDHLADAMYKVIANEVVKAPVFPKAAELAPLVGSYALENMKLAVVITGNRIYLDGPGAPRVRMIAISDHEFWIEELQSVAVFEREGDKIKRLVFVLGEHQMSATRIDEAKP